MDLTLGAGGAGYLQMVLNQRFTPFLDPLSHGPIRPFTVDSLERWVLLRKAYWAEEDRFGMMADTRWESAYLRTIDAILSAKELTHWSASDVDGLLLSAWLVHLIHARKTGCQLNLVRFPRQAGSSISIMPRDVIETPPRPVPIVGKDADFLLSLWHAWGASSPQLLLKLFVKATPQHSRRFLLSLLLDRYPDAKMGLSRWDYTLLRNVHEHGPQLGYVIGHTLAEVCSSFDNVGDQWMGMRLFRMARLKGKKALVTISRDENQPRRESITLTPLGAEILAGRLNALDAGMPPDWIGGVRNGDSKSNVWVRTSDGLARRK